MKLNLNGLSSGESWQSKGIALPGYDPVSVRSRSMVAPRWAHFGIGNIFRVFIAGIADTLLREGETDCAVCGLEVYDPEIVSRIFQPHDQLVLSVLLHSSGQKEMRVLASVAESVHAAPGSDGMERARAIFASPSLQMVSFTITEKGYALRDASGALFPSVEEELRLGPEAAHSAVPVVTALLAHRYAAGAAPLALVSMDNCASNGDRLRAAVLDTAAAWTSGGFLPAAFLDWVSDEARVAFPCTMIDKIVPRPSEELAAQLAALGLEDMAPLMTSRQTFIAPFVNAEPVQYLVIEDRFPNGRPPLEKAGVILCGRETVDRAEKMKVTACLNPIHSSLAPFGQLLGFRLFSDQITSPDSLRLARAVGAEGMAVVPDPGILSPEAFFRECLEERFPNPFLGDTVQRLLTDISQGLSVRFGETVKAYVRRDGSARALRAIPLALAGYLRYLLAVDDQGRPYGLAPDPMNEELRSALDGVEFGRPDSLRGQLRPILSNARLFGTDLYAAGIGETVEEEMRTLLAGPGAAARRLSSFRA